LELSRVEDIAATVILERKMSAVIENKKRMRKPGKKSEANFARLTLEGRISEACDQREKRDSPGSGDTLINLTSNRNLIKHDRAVAGPLPSTVAFQESSRAP
jgi:hypothetical protein